MAGCIFCDIAQGKTGALIYEDDTVAAFRDINPQAPTHVLIVPKEHVATLDELADEPVLLGRLFMAAITLARREGIAEGGYRVVANCGAGAGQSIWHVHLHLFGGRVMHWPPG